jgi:hypothetical protein
VVPIPDTDSFIARWSSSGAAERANYQLFLSELCDLLGVDRPDPTKPDDAENAYVFERTVTFHHADGTPSTGRIDLYKRGCYVLEAKQDVEKREQEAALSEAWKAKAKAAKKGTAQRGSAAPLQHHGVSCGHGASFRCAETSGASQIRVEDILGTLASLGQARAMPAGKYVTA